MSAAQSLAQRKAALWADPSSRVFALLDGSVLPDLPARLAAAEMLGWDCLARGALTPEAAARAPYLADLSQTSEFSDWLLDAAGSTFPGWGIVLVTRKGLLAVRQHCRALGEVALPDGAHRNWRWYDPQLLQTLLPQFSPGQLDELFGPGLALVVPSTDAWTWHTLEQGLLVSTPRGNAPAAAR
ncbi:MAG: DUF4123 domain-containing protein [Burkholderiaceae bacterium]